MRALVAVVVVAALGALAAPARADESYRAPVIVTDVVADVLMIRGLGKMEELPGVLGVGAYLLGAPGIHAAHGHWGRAGGSIALRITAPVGLAWLGCKLTPRNKHDPTSECGFGMAAGFLVGLLGAQIFDWTILSRSTGDVEPTARMFRIGGSF